MVKQLEADIVIIGGGTAGLAAAVTAAEHGAKTVLFEKAATTGGTGNMAMGMFAVESRLQRLMQLDLTREEAFKIFMNYTHWRVDARLVKAYIDKSPSTIDWLESMGVGFAEAATYFPGSNFTWHLIKTRSGGPGIAAGSLMMKVLTKKAMELGAEIYLKTPARKIMKKNGTITGLLAEDRSGESIHVDAKAVIVATGGFGNNPEMIKKYTEYTWGRDLFSFRIPGINGEGIRMAWEVGAAEGAMSMHLIYDTPLGAKSPQNMPVYRILCHQPNLMVNLSGERFINEEIMGNTTFTGNAIAQQRNRCAFNIFDEATKRYFEDNGIDYIAPNIRAMRVEKISEDFQYAITNGNSNVFIAGSIEEISEKTGIALQKLKRTIEEYNRSCAVGYDEMFYKNHKYLKPIKEPPFYILRLFPSGYGSLGGIMINCNTEVLDKNGDTITGLYAVGNDANSIYGDSYIFYLPGNTMGFAVNSGRIAGENAAEYALKMKH